MTTTDPRPTRIPAALRPVTRAARGSVAAPSPRRLSMLARVAELVPVGLAGTTVAAVAIAGPGLRIAGPAVLIAGLLIGLPHGALDVDRGGRRLHPVGRALFSAAYAAAAAVTFALWWRWPTVVLVGLLALALVHFGDGDIAVASWSRRVRAPGAAAATGRRARLWRAASTVAFGGLAVVTPFARWPGRTAPLLQRLGDAGTIDGLARAALPAVLMLAAAVAVRAMCRGDRWTAGALLVLGALFWTAAPLLAFGVYFAGWHSLRQVCQQLAAERGAGPADTSRGAPARTGRLVDWLARAALPTAVTLVTLALLTWRTGMRLPVTYLAVLLSVTVPHSLVDAWLARSNPV